MSLRKANSLLEFRRLLDKALYFYYAIARFA